MSKPTNLPNWATDGTEIIEPSAAKKAKGHISGEQPIPQYVNWVLNLIYLWIVWLNGLWASDGSLTLDNNANLTLQGTGSITAGTGGITVGSGGDVTLQGTGYLKSGNFTSSFGFDTAGWNSSGAAPTWSVGTTGAEVDVAASVTAYRLLQLPDDTCRVQGLVITALQGGSVDGTASLVLANANGSGAIYGAIAGASVAVTHGGSANAFTITPTTPFMLVSTPGSTPDHTVWLKVTAGSGGVLGLLSAQWILDRP